MDERPALEPEGAVSDPVERSWIRRLGPGLVTGAADDDPSGIGTYAQTGAQFGYNLLWTLVLTYPLMVAIQLVCARVGRVTGKGLASNMRVLYPHWLLYGAVGLLLVANIMTIAADLAAMGASAALLLKGPQQVYVVILGVLCAVLQIFIPYERYARLLKWTALSLLAYVAVVLVVPVKWNEVAHAIVLPRVTWSNSFLRRLSRFSARPSAPICSSGRPHRKSKKCARPDASVRCCAPPVQAPAQLRRIGFDTWIGMGVSNGIGFFIMLTAAATLHLHHIEVKTSADAARALEPIAGPFAYALFALGIIGTGLLALPVLAGSAAYAAAGTFRWRSSLALHLTLAREFYAVIVLSMVGGVLITFTHLDPMRALYWSSVINGLTAVPIMVVLMLMAQSRRIMGQFTIRGILRAGGWLATLAMLAAAVGMFLPG